MAANTELTVAINVSNIRGLQRLRNQLRNIVRDSRRANRELRRLQRGAGMAAGPGRQRRHGTLLGPGQQGGRGQRQLRRQVQQTKGELQQMNRTGDRAMQNLASGSRKVADEMNRVQQFAHLTQQVLEVFVLYRGFVFLSSQAQQLVDSMEELEFQAARVQTMLEEVGATNFRSSIEDQIVDISQRTGAEMEQVAQTQFDIVSANIELAESTEALDQTARAAVAGGLNDMQTAFQSAVTQANAFNVSLTDTNELLDKQFQALRRGIFTYEQFVQVAGEVSVAFSNIGQNVEQANAAVSAISQVFTGPQLRRGATGLRNMALALGDQADEFERLGVEVFDSQGDFREFTDIILDLEDALSDMDERERFEALQDIFPQRRELRGAIGLLQNTDQLQQFLVEQQFAAGSVDRAFGEMNDTFRQQSQILGNNLLPAGRTFLDLLKDMAEAANTLEDAFPGATAGGLQFLMSLGVAGGARAFASGMFPRNLQTPSTGGPMAPSFFGGMGATRAATGVSARGPSQALRPSIGGVGPFPMGTRRNRVLQQVAAMGPAGLALTGGAAALGGVQSAQRPGINAQDLIAGVGGPAATGAVVGGLPGAAIGATAGTVAVAIGEALADEAPEPAKTFAEAFKESLQEETADISTAFATALVEGEAAGENPLINVAEFLTEQAGQELELREGQIERQRDVGVFKDTPVEDLVRTLNDVSPVTNRGGIMDRPVVGPTAGGVPTPQQEEVIARGRVPEFGEALQARRKARRQAEQQFQELSPTARDFLEQEGFDPEQAGGIAAEQAVQSLFDVPVDDLKGEMADLVQQFRTLVEFADQSDASVEEVNTAFANFTADARQHIQVIQDNEATEQQLIEARQNLQDLTIGLVQNLDEANQGADRLGGSLSTLTVEFNQLEGPIEDLHNQISELENVDTELAGPLEQITQLRERRQTVEDLAAVGVGQDTPLRDPLAPISEDLEQDIQEAKQEFVNTLAGQTTDDLRTTINNMLDGGKDAADSVQNLADEANKFGDVVGVNTMELQAFFEQALTAVQQDIIQPTRLFGDSIEQATQAFDSFNQIMQTVGVLENLRNLADKADLPEEQQATIDGALRQASQHALTQFQGELGPAIAGSLGLEDGEAGAAELVKAIFDTVGAIEDVETQAQETEQALEIPSATDLDQTMFEASRLLEQDLVASSQFTADQMQRMGEDLQNLNRTIRQVQMIREFERLGGIVNDSVDLTGTIESVLGDLTLGGETLASLLENPEDLADFLTDIEFGDVEVDQREIQENQFIIRITSNAASDPEAAARAADRAVEQINKRTEELNA